MDGTLKESDHQPGPSTGATGPVPTQVHPTNNDSVTVYACEFPGCDRSFPTKIGRGIHHRVHKDWNDARQNIQHIKGRWNQEESALLARQEAHLTLKGVKFINQELLRFFPNRTIEAIKGQRRKEHHKATVEQLLHAMRSQVTASTDNNTCDDRTVRPSTSAAPDAMLSTPSTSHDRNSDISFEDLKEKIVSYIDRLPPFKSTNFNSERLSLICRSLNHWSRAQIFEEISLYFRETFPFGPSERNKHRTFIRPGTSSRRKQRRAEYARIQNAWKKCRTSCIRSILKDKKTVLAPPKEAMIPFWERVMTSGDTSTPGVSSTKEVLVKLWDPILPGEIRSAYPEMGTASGPDGFSAKSIRKVPLGVMTRIYNILILCGRLPVHLLESRTTLIPKKNEASEPGEFRPITVSSIFARTFHKVLANRMGRCIKLDERQKAFRPIDGCSENIFLMDFALRYSRQNFKPLFMASLDVAKAFDSVTHKTIIDTLRSFGVPRLMCEYIQGTYAESVTRLREGDWESHAIHPTCGVKQGDPLSPMIFNLVIDRLFSKLPKEVGIRLGDTILNSIGYADDLVLFATTAQGLQELLDVSTDYLKKCGLRTNSSKCFTVALKNVPKEKRSVVDASHTFKCAGQAIPALKRSDDWKYLGVPFTPEGRLASTPMIQLRRDINTLNAAPLKPQQRLFTLRTVVLPSLYHHLVLGLSNISLLNKLDIEIRKAVRKWLVLPHDVPNAYFHADVKDGGLSIPSLRWIIPLQRLHRIKNLKIIENGVVPDAMKRFNELELGRVEQRLKDHIHNIYTMTDYKQRFARLLHKSNDGRPLLKSRSVDNQHSWITDGNLFVSGRDFVHMNKLRINAIPLRSRMARGRIRDHQCRAGCRDAETLHHVLQLCHRTHEARIRRHNASLDYLLQRQNKNSTIIKEPKFRTDLGLKKPDAIILKDNTAVVIDAIIAGERVDLNATHQAKIDKYIALKPDIQERYSVERVIFTSLTLSSRGIWSEKSFIHLCKLGLLRSGDAKILSSRVLIGGLQIINIFHRMTSTRRLPMN